MPTDPYEALKAHILLKAPFTEEECQEILARFKVKTVKKKQIIIQPDFVAQYRNYVAAGALRAYVIDENGVDHTIQFAVEDWWISDYNSYIYQRPATMFVAAIEDSTILQLSYQQEQELKQMSHRFETFFRLLAERSAAFFQRRIIASLTQTAEERYHDFAEQYPAVAQRLPQYAIASYLGMTTEFLSKIRNNKLKKKG